MSAMAVSTRRWVSTAVPLKKPKRMRTMARQVYAFAVAKARGWDGPADRLISHGIDVHDQATAAPTVAAGCAR